MATTHDIHNGGSFAKSINPQAITTTTQTGAAVDLLGYNAAEVIFEVGAITDGTFTPSITECDTSGGTYTAVTATDIIGTLVAFTTVTPQSYGYIGSKRYIKAVVTVAGATVGGYCSAGVFRNSPNRA